MTNTSSEPTRPRKGCLFEEDRRSPLELSPADIGAIILKRQPRYRLTARMASEISAQRWV